MEHQNETHQFNVALLANFLLKTKILVLLFGIVLALQIAVVTYFLTQTELIGTVIPNEVLLGPVFLISIFITELFTARYLKKMVGREDEIKISFIYLVTFIEVCFPAAVMFSIGIALSNTLGHQPINVLNSTYAPLMILSSPLFVMFFIMITLSSLLLNFRLSLFAGIVAGVVFFSVSLYLLSINGMLSNIECFNAGAKSIFMIITGLLSAFVSKKIREAIISSLNSKNELIFNLDKRVNEKTAEISFQKDEIQKANLLLSEKNKEVLDSIHYAKRIQGALLASDDLLKKNLNEYFVFYKPKDIVSGDFYWAEERNGLFYIITADCTGHGVPGAFMSLLNISFLNEAINNTEFVNPNEILNYSRSRIISALKADGSESGGKDGMDGVLCVFNFKTKRLMAACANNPLWIIRENELIEIKPDKFPVGKHDKDKTPFTLQDIKLQKGDLVYTLTDGFSDQFGGIKGKKYKKTQIKTILINNCTKPLSEQKEILENEFQKWKGNLEQLDDVLLIGIRV